MRRPTQTESMLKFDPALANRRLVKPEMRGAFPSFGRYLKVITCVDCAGWLTFYGKLKVAFQHIRGFDSRMRVSRNFDSGLYCFFHK